jgi:hypothetical protein
MDLKQVVVEAVCQFFRGSEGVPDEILSDALEAVWADDSVPPAVQAWIFEVVPKRLATKARRDRRRAGRRAPPEVLEIGTQHAVGRFVQQRNPVVDAATVKELRTFIARDTFEKEAVAVLLGEHPEYKNFGEFARRQKFCSKAHTYKRRALLRQRLRDCCTALQTGAGVRQ